MRFCLYTMHVLFVMILYVAHWHAFCGFCTLIRMHACIRCRMHVPYVRVRCTHSTYSTQYTSMCVLYCVYSTQFYLYMMDAFVCRACMHACVLNSGVDRSAPYTPPSIAKKSLFTDRAGRFYQHCQHLRNRPSR
jgi:hypothetical protein